MAEQRKPKIDPRDYEWPDEKPMSEMTWEELKEFYRSKGLPSPRPLMKVWR